MNWLLIFLGGGLGSVARYGLSQWIKGYEMPWATILANILATAILALVVIFSMQQKWLDDHPTRLFLAVGVCGGFSTFSTFSLETFNLLSQGNWGFAITNVLISVLACVALVYVLFKTVSV